MIPVREKALYLLPTPLPFEIGTNGNFVWNCYDANEQGSVTMDAPRTNPDIRKLLAAQARCIRMFRKAFPQFRDYKIQSAVRSMDRSDRDQCRFSLLHARILRIEPHADRTVLSPSSCDAVQRGIYLALRGSIAGVRVREEDKTLHVITSIGMCLHTLLNCKRPRRAISY